MKTSKISTQYGINRIGLERFIKAHDIPFTEGILGMDIDENAFDIPRIVNDFNAEQESKQREEAELARQRAEFEAEKQQACASMLITSGFSFDGYKVVKYSGYISGDDVVEIPRGTKGAIFNMTTNVGDALSEALVRIRRNALQELKEAAFALGCNAVIGVDFDYITLDPETANSSGGTCYLPYVFCVTANGNAVVIEKVD